MLKNLQKSAVAIAFLTVSGLSGISFGQTADFPWRSQVDTVTPAANRSTPTARQSTSDSPYKVEQIRVASRPVAARRPIAATLPVPTQQAAAPRPPATNRQPFLVSFARQAAGVGSNQETEIAGNLIDTQPSISDIDAYRFDTPNAPEATSSDLEYPGNSPAPSLATPKAPEDNTDYCNQPRKSRFDCDLGCEKKLFGSSPGGFQMGGWASLGYHNRLTDSKNDRPEQFGLHQFWLYGEKAASRDSMAWDTGFRIDGLYGLDGQDLQAFGNSPTGTPDGWDNDWDNGSFGFALPQMYVQFANCNWDVKAGKFFSPFGYEVIAAPDNFFYSNNYTMYNSEPFTMTGLLGERRINDSTSVIVGATAGWDTGFDRTDGGFTAITGLRKQINPDVNLALTSSIGDTGYRGSGIASTAVAQVRLTDSVDYVFHGNVLNLDDNNEFGIVQYLFREMTPCLSLGARLEWWKTDALFGGPNRSTYDFTVGANYRTNANLVIRPELRFDWGAAAVDPGTPIVGIDAVMTF